jgi:hypothetical protein
VLVSDGYFRCKDIAVRKRKRGNTKKKNANLLNAKRFFNIASVLPMELQMLLCNQVLNLSEDLIVAKNREVSFSNVLREERELELF